jgi:hypothetical protein
MIVLGVLMPTLSGILNIAGGAIAVQLFSSLEKVTLNGLEHSHPRRG